MKRLMLTATYFLVEHFLAEDVRLVPIILSIDGIDVSPKAILSATHKKPLEALAENGDTSAIWEADIASAEENFSQSLLAEIVALIQEEGLHRAAAFKDSEGVLHVPIVERYRQAVGLVTELETFLSRHENATAHWSFTAERDVNQTKSDEVSSERQTSTEYYQETIYFLLKNYNEGDRSDTRHTTPNMGLREFILIISRQYRSPLDLLNSLEQEIPLALEILDSLAFENERLQKIWESWYSTFRSKLDDLQNAVAIDERIGRLEERSDPDENKRKNNRPDGNEANYSQGSGWTQT